ncbi:MAG: phosphotransferase enzyme family protein [Anaerolineales bacterium]
MKPYEELTRRGRIGRMRKLAEIALKVFGFHDAHFSFLHEAGNILFKVNKNQLDSIQDNDVYINGQYLLRIHQPGYQKREGIELELKWLDAMCRDEGLPVPKPFATNQGDMLITISIAGIPEDRNVSLLQWVRGRKVTKNIHPKHFQAQGYLMGRIHEHSSKWDVPISASKRKYDWDGLFREDLGEGMSAIDAWSFLPKEYIKPYEIIAEKLRIAMDKLGESRDVYGLIHGDLGMDANLLFWRGEARAIDFDDSGYGYYIYDLSLALEHCQGEEVYSIFKDALLNGYVQVRPECVDQMQYLDLFLQAFNVYLSLWAATAIIKYPKYQRDLENRMERAYNMVIGYLENTNH